ncbi:HNH endonuclease, partial [Streptomyces sp. NPDC006129]|uniref:HNH endonuclease n=1 Tax=Streptomyces sp. NPDC006129 TaxID=3155348 RepID=UPI00339E1285
MAGNPRNGRPYRRLTAQQRALGLPCWICGHDIDPTLDPRDPWSWTLESCTARAPRTFDVCSAR